VTADPPRTIIRKIKKYPCPFKKSRTLLKEFKFTILTKGQQNSLLMLLKKVYNYKKHDNKMQIIFSAIFLFLISLIFAFLEIEIEGKNGWAKNIPTWYRKSGFSKLFYKISYNKPLTRYHLFVLLFIFFLFHSGFFFNLSWTIQNKLKILLNFLILILIEGFLWFEFNPNYGIRKFGKKEIWWHGRTKWFFGIPQSYFLGFGLLFVLSYIFSKLLNNFQFFMDYLFLMGTITLLVILSFILVKPYHGWYKKMRKIDESKEFNRKIKFE